MSGYQWYVTVRTSPASGDDETFDLMQEFTDVGGPTEVEVEYDLVSEDFEDVNRTLRPRHFGWRVKVEMECLFTTMEEEAVLTTIANRLIDDNWTVYLSLDNQENEREVVLTRFRGPRPIEGKTVAGAIYQLELECADLITEKPALNSGNW